MISVRRALLRTVQSELKGGTLADTLIRSVRARTLAFAHEPSFGELLEQAAAADPEREFLRFEEQRIRLGEIERRASAVAAGLAEITRPGEQVALMSPNCPEFLEAFFAIQKLGLGAVPVNTALVGDGLSHVLESSGASVAIVHRDHLAELRAVRPKLREIVVITEGGEAPDGYRTQEAWKAAGGRHVARRPDPEAIALLMYTSGTTGGAKGVVYRYKDSNSKRLRLLAHLLYEPSDLLSTCLPLFHANALWLTTMTALLSGARVALGRRFRASRFWQEVGESGATTFNALGAMIPILLKQPPSPADRAHRVRFVSSAACPESAWRPFEERFGVKIVEGYGAVDGGGFLTLNLGNAPVGSIGKPIGGKYRLVDEAGSDVPAESPGELWVWLGKRGERKVEYYKNAAATADKSRGDGWLRTGDLLRKDAKGFLYFVGRKSDSMRRRGENVSAFEVESVIEKHPDVLECAVFGVPSELGEDEIMAAVVPIEGRTIEPAELRAFLEPRLARHALPRYIEIFEELPKTGTHRVQKSALAARGVTPSTWEAA
jgi:carnitine-CoA ligase